MNRPFLLCAFAFSLLATCRCFAQEPFVYAGYRVGKYLTAEGDPQVYAGKFNLGWDFSKTGDNALIFFDPGSKQYDITKYMEYGNLPQGITLGVMIPLQEEMSIELGFHQFNQKAIGKRVSVADNTEEKFTLQSKSGGICMNLVWTHFAWFKPFIGLDFGRSRLRYSYESSAFDVHKQRLGYNVHLFGSTRPGDKPLYLGWNFGASLRVVGTDNFSLCLVPQYQERIDSFEDIFCGVYRNLKFHHDNWSLSVQLVKSIK